MYIIFQLRSFDTTRYLYLMKSVGFAVPPLSFRKSAPAKTQRAVVKDINAFAT